MPSLNTLPLEVTSYCLLLASSTYSSFPRHFIDVINNDKSAIFAIPSVIRISAFPLYCDNPHRHRANIRQVCRLWNTIVTESPIFWKDIIISKDIPLRILSSWMAKARHLPLTVMVNLPEGQRHATSGQGNPDRTLDRNLEVILDFFTLAGSRIAELDVFAGCALAMFTALPRIDTVLYGHNIRTISIHYFPLCRNPRGHIRRTLRLPPLPMTIDVPALRHLVLTGISLPIPVVYPLISRLSSLDIRATKSALEKTTKYIPLQQLVRDCPNLTLLRLVLAHWPALPPSTPPIEMYHLESLTVASEDVDEMFDFVLLLNAPQVAYLSVAILKTHIDYSLQFRRLHAGSTILGRSIFSGLHTLILTWAFTDRQLVNDILEESTQLYRLGLYNVGKSQSGTKLFLHHLLDSSMETERNTRQDNNYDVLCPLLRVVEVQDSDGGMEADLQEVRTKLGVPLNIVTVNTKSFSYTLPYCR